MTDFIATVLSWLYDIWPSYAGAIVLLTLIIMVLVTPLTLKSTKSMMETQRLQPEIKRLQNQYRDDRQKLNEELMAFYKEHNINPMGGCLPLLVQMPVFFALYGVLQGLTRRSPDAGFGVGWVSGQFAQGLDASSPPSPELNFDPAYLKPESALNEALSSTNTMLSWGLDLSESASDALGRGLLHALPYLLLIVVVAVSGFVQQRQIQGRNPNAEINPQQQMIMKIMPIMLPVFSFALPSGLVLYFAVSNGYRVGMQAWISRNIYGVGKGDPTSAKAVDGDDGKSAKPAKESKPGPRGGKDRSPVRTGGGDDGESAVDLGKGRPTPSRKEADRARAGGGQKKPSGSRAKPGRSAKPAGGKATPPARPTTAQPRARKRKR